MEKMFFGLSVSGVDYVTRIERLVRRFDREDVYRDNLLQQLSRLQASKGENEEALEKAVYAIKTFMDNASHHEKSSRWLLDTLEDHLPESMLRQYNFDLRMNRHRHTAARLTQWLDLYLESLMDTRQMKRSVDERRGKVRNGHRDQVHAAQEGTEKALPPSVAQQMVAQDGEGGPCCFCRKDHDIYHCAKFFSLTPSGRRQAIDKYQGCYLCLKTGHFILECPSKLKCRFCGGKHNSSLHLMPTEDPTTQEGTAFSGTEERRVTRSTSSQGSSSGPVTRESVDKNKKPPLKLPMEEMAVGNLKTREQVLKPVKEKVSGLTEGKRTKREDVRPEDGEDELKVEKRLEEEGLKQAKAELRRLVEAENSLATLAVAIGPRKLKVNALLDTGADNASLDASFAEKCGFQALETGPYSVKVGGGRINTYADVGIGFLPVSNLADTYQTSCVVRTYPKPVGALKPVNWNKRKLMYPHLADLPIEEINEEEPVALLLGTRHPQLFEVLDVRRGGKDEPWAFLSPLGWVVVGPRRWAWKQRRYDQYRTPVYGG